MSAEVESFILAGGRSGGARGEEASERLEAKGRGPNTNARLAHFGNQPLQLLPRSPPRARLSLTTPPSEYAHLAHQEHTAWSECVSLPLSLPALSSSTPSSSSIFLLIPISSTAPLPRLASPRLHAHRVLTACLPSPLAPSQPLCPVHLSLARRTPLRPHLAHANSPLQTHLLPPNLLKLFAPRPPLPYAKPPGRDPDLPLKSLSSRRAPQPIVVAPVLDQIRQDQAGKDDKLLDAGVPPAKARGEGDDLGLGDGDETRDKAQSAEVKLEDAGAETDKAKQVDEGERTAEGDVNMGGDEDKEEGEEDVDAAAAKAKAVAASMNKASSAKVADKPTDAVTIDLCAEEQFQMRRRERERRRKEAMSKPCASLLAGSHTLPPAS